MFAPESPSRKQSRRASRSFNEAGACLPRKAVQGHPQADRGEGFNEAGACLPRKGNSPGTNPPDVVASMRPGHVCPGNMVQPPPGR